MLKKNNQSVEKKKAFLLYLFIKKNFFYHSIGGGRGFRIGSGGGFNLLMRILASGFFGSFGLASKGFSGECTEGSL